MTGSSPSPAVGRAAAQARRFRTPRTILALMLREMQTTYGRSPGGYVWAILEPVGGIALLTLILSVGFRIREPALGTSFPLFFATGVLPLSIFTSISGRVAGAIRFSRPLLFYPGVVYSDAVLGRFLLTFLTQLLVFYIVMVGIHLIFDVATIRNYPAIFGAFALAGLLGLGVGVFNCFLGSVWTLWPSIWSILTRPLFLVSGIFFIYDDIPRDFQPYALYNPLIHVVGLMRRGFYATYDAPYVSVVFVALAALVPMALGFMLLNRHVKVILND